jgi:hypothetical protein
MKVVVFCGGEGTRFKKSIEEERKRHSFGFDEPTLDLLAQKPKVLAPVGGTPFLHHLIQYFATQGFADIILFSGRNTSEIRQSLADKKEWSIQFEETPLTNNDILGSLFDLRENLGKTFIVAFGDRLSDLNVKQLLDGHNQKSSRMSIGATARHHVFTGVGVMNAETLDPGNLILREYLPQKPPLYDTSKVFFNFLIRGHEHTLHGATRLWNIDELGDYYHLLRDWNSGKAYWYGAYTHSIPQGFTQDEIQKLAREIPLRTSTRAKEVKQ